MKAISSPTVLRSLCSLFPGEDMVREAMACGIDSIRDADKVKALGIELIESRTISVPGLRQAIANIELRKRSMMESGDHLIVCGEVSKFGVNVTAKPRPLLSIGPDTGGYRVLAEHGIHRIAVVDG